MSINNKLRYIGTSRSNSFKTFLIMAFLTGLITFLGLLVAYATNNPSYILLALIVAIGQNIISYFFGDKIALSMSGAEKADPVKYADLHRLVENLAIKYELPKPEVYVVNDPAPNAFATGRGKNHASVAATTGLLVMLDRSELEGVMAHELTHIKNNDMLVMTIVVTMSAVLSSIANMAMYASMSSRNKDGNNAILLVIALLGNILLPVASLLIQSAVSRKREFMADAGSALLTENPDSLASALSKISGFKQPLQNANSATAHLYISCPFGGNEGQSFLQKLFLTHPPVEERIKALIG